MTEINFNNLPEAVNQLSIKLDNMEKSLLKISNEHRPEADQLLTVQQAADFLNLKPVSIYGKVNRREIPFMKRSKRLYFSRLELMEYIKSGRRKTVAEIEAEADTYLINKKKGANYDK